MTNDIKIASFSVLGCFCSILYCFKLTLEKLPCLRPKESFISIIPYSPSVNIFRDKNIILLFDKEKKKKQEKTGNIVKLWKIKITTPMKNV